jgi:hypothetical protein
MRNHLLLLLVCLAPSLAKPQQSPTIKLDYFTATPKEFDGCLESYTYTTTALKDEKYIFFSNLQELAMIRVKGKIIHLKKVSESHPSSKNSKSIYKGEGYTVTTLMKEVRPEGDEGSYMKGTLEVKFGAATITLAIHGFGGC